MVTMLTTAHDALKTSSEVLQKLNGQAPSTKSTSFWHRWPVALGVFTCTVATVTAVAMAVIGSFIMAAPVGLCAVGCGIISFYVYTYLDFGDLSEYITAFSQRVSALSKTALGLNQVNHDLDKVQKELRDQIKDRERGMEKSQKETNEALDKLEKVTTQLAETRGQLESLKKVFDGSQKVVDLLSQKMKEFFTLEGKMTASSVELKALLTHVQGVRKEVSKNLHELGKDKSVANQRKQARKAADEIFTQFELMVKKFTEVQIQNEIGKKQIENLKNVDSSLSHSTQTLGGKVDALETQLDRASAVLAQFKSASGT